MKTAIRVFEIGLWLIAFFALVWPPFGLSMGYFNAADGGLFWSALWGTIINALLFYGNSIYLMPVFLAKGKKIEYASYLLLLFLGTSALEVVLDYALLSYMNKATPILDGELWGMAFSFNFLFLFLSFGYGFFRIWLMDSQQRKELERDKLSAELNFLRTQINPHFLFNTLNNLFAMSRKSGDYATADQLAKLAGIMRYMLYETNAERVPLQKEVEYLKNYIELQKLRFQFSDPIEITCEWPKEQSLVKVAPFLLIPFVENAFQYGISLSKPSVIKLKLREVEGVIYFTLENTVHVTKLKDVGGIGLKNATQRLSLIYPGKHEIKVNSNQDFYHIELKIECDKQ